MCNLCDQWEKPVEGSVCEEEMDLNKAYELWLYKVVQIWPGQTVTCLHTNRPGHIWTTLYFCVNYHE
jgi:hypothetical protein